MDVLSTPHAASHSAKSLGEGAPTPITDFAVIERQKENIRPSATGRSAATLSSLFEVDEAAKIIREGHEAHRRAIEEAERKDADGEDIGEEYLDILDVYTKYITFTNQHHPSSTTHILPLLERTARKFVDDPRYAQDIRLLRVWVQYARYTDRREEIWSFLERKEVGTNHAEFYEQWATALEALKRKKKADEIYRLGIARRAAPLERLKNRHQAFLARIMAPPDGVIPDDEPVPVPPTSRSVLGQVGAPASTSGSLAGATQIASTGRSSRAPNGAKMEIFADGLDGRGEDTTPNEWDDFGTRDSRRKENVLEATPWKGETLPQKRVAPRTPKVEVFRDANENESVRPAEEHLLRIRAPQSEAEMLKHDPLRNFDLTALSSKAPPTLPPVPALKEPKVKKSSRAPRSGDDLGKPWSVPTDGPEVKDPKGKVQRRMFDWKAVYKNDEEWSFEEVRARQRGLLGKEWRGEVQDWEREWHAPGSTTPKKEAPKKKMPSPTVNTKLAQEEVGMWFNQTIHGGKIRDDSDSEDEEDEEDEDEDGVADAIPLTPLPAPGSVLRPTTGMVPPTPTPNSDYRPLMATPAPMIYNDENAMVPPSTNKKFNIFSETPAKTPLATRTPLAVSSSKPRPFGIFSEITEEEERDETATPSVRRTALAPVNIFATPALGDKHILGSTILEEPEEGQDDGRVEEVGQESTRPNIFATPSASIAPPRVVPEEKLVFQDPIPEEMEENAPEAAQETVPLAAVAPEIPARQPFGTVSNIFATPAVKRAAYTRQPLAHNAFAEEDEDEAGEPTGEQMGQEEFVNINEYDEDGLPEGSGRFKPFAILTPITERTCEYTAYTQFSALRQSTTGRSSIATLAWDEEANEGFVTSTEPAPLTGLSAVEEEDERSSLRNSRSARTSVESGFSPAADRSGMAGPGFALPEGFTIHAKLKRESESGSVVVLDGETMRSRQGTAEPELGPQLPEERLEEKDTEVTEDDDFVTAQHGPGGDIPNPCSPIDDDVLRQLLARIDPPLASMSVYHDGRPAVVSKLDALNKHTAAKPRRSSAANSRVSIAPEPGFSLDLAGKQYEVREKIGEGGYGAVFLGVDVAARQALDDADSDEEDEVDEDAEDNCLVAIKVEKPASVWESVVLHRLHSRLDSTISRSIIQQRDLYEFEDESYLLLDYSAQGTLLDVVNKAPSMGIAPATMGASPSVDELVAVFFTVELLRVVEGLHRANFIHGDLKIDNCMVRLEDLPNSAWSIQYSPKGENGWSSKGVRLIDFGRGIDLDLFENQGKQQRFIADWDVDQRDCTEMREGREWSYETDYYGLAGICYCLLFGRYIGTVEEEGKRYKIDQPLKRYWQAELWNPLFDLLLNPKMGRPDAALPVTDELAELRGRFEDWLVENCQKGGKSLRAMLKKIELAAMTARRG